MRISEALGAIRELAVEFPGGSVLNIRYRPSSYTVADISNIDEEARKDPYRIIAMIRDMVVDWDLTEDDGTSVSLKAPMDPGAVINEAGEPVQTQYSKIRAELSRQELLASDPIAQKVPITLLVAIIRAVNEDQSAGN